MQQWTKLNHKFVLPKSHDCNQELRIKLENVPALSNLY